MGELAFSRTGRTKSQASHGHLFPSSKVSLGVRYPLVDVIYSISSVATVGMQQAQPAAPRGGAAVRGRPARGRGVAGRGALAGRGGPAMRGAPGTRAAPRGRIAAAGRGGPATRGAPIARGAPAAQGRGQAHAPANAAPRGGAVPQPQAVRSGSQPGHAGVPLVAPTGGVAPHYPPQQPPEQHPGVGQHNTYYSETNQTYISNAQQSSQQ